MRNLNNPAPIRVPSIDSSMARPSKGPWSEPLPTSAPKVFRDAQADGQTRLADLLARIPSVLVRVSGASTDSAQATLDDKPLDIASGVAVHADPGSHVVRVVADDRMPFEKTISLPNKGGVVVVDAVLQSGDFVHGRVCRGRSRCGSRGGAPRCAEKGAREFIHRNADRALGWSANDGFGRDVLSLSDQFYGGAPIHLPSE